MHAEHNSQQRICATERCMASTTLHPTIAQILRQRAMRKNMGKGAISLATHRAPQGQITTVSRSPAITTGMMTAPS